MVIYIIFTIFFIFVFAYFFSFEYCRYKTAKMIAAGLGEKAVFKLGGSYMRRSYDGVEERAWIVPDDKMAGGSLLSVLSPSLSKLFLQRYRDPGFRFDIEPRTSILFQTLSLGTLKDTKFNVPQLDQSLRLRTNNQAEANRYFLAPEKQQALTALFLAGVTRLKSGNGGIIATMQGISTEDLNPERIDILFKHLRSF